MEAGVHDMSLSSRKEMVGDWWDGGGMVVGGRHLMLFSNLLSFSANIAVESMPRTVPCPFGSKGRGSVHSGISQTRSHDKHRIRSTS